MPGIQTCATTPTMNVVKKTRPNALNKMLRLYILKLYQLVFHEASYNNGGKKIRKTISGRNDTAGRPGIRLIMIPESTNTIGKGNLYLLLIIANTTTPNNSSVIKSNFIHGLKLFIKLF